MAPPQRRKVSSTELRREQLRLARVDAPTLRQLLPDAAQVRVELTFNADTRLAQTPRQFTVYPPAQAHFVYACPFGDCDGTYDLNEAVFDMLRAQTCQAAGVLHCLGHKTHRGGLGAQCGLGVTYAATASYAAVLPGLASRPALAP